VFIASYFKNRDFFFPYTIPRVVISKRLFWTRYVVQEGNQKCLCREDLLLLT
jgi:hypothetical protein